MIQVVKTRFTQSENPGMAIVIYVPGLTIFSAAKALKAIYRFWEQRYFVVHSIVVPTTKTHLFGVRIFFLSNLCIVEKKNRLENYFLLLLFLILALLLGAPEDDVFAFFFFGVFLLPEDFFLFFGVVFFFLQRLASDPSTLVRLVPSGHFFAKPRIKCGSVRLLRSFVLRA